MPHENRLVQLYNLASVLNQRHNLLHWKMIIFWNPCHFLKFCARIPLFYLTDAVNCVFNKLASVFRSVMLVVQALQQSHGSRNGVLDHRFGLLGEAELIPLWPNLVHNLHSFGPLLPAHRLSLPKEEAVAQKYKNVRNIFISELNSNMLFYFHTPLTPVFPWRWVR